MYIPYVQYIIKHININIYIKIDLWARFIQNVGVLLAGGCMHTGCLHLHSTHKI